MFLYAGIDEAGYGPLFGPLLISCAALAIAAPPAPPPASRDVPVAVAPPDLWRLLRTAVCTDRTCPKGRIAVNDSKKLHHSSDTSHRLRHLERACLSFAALAGHRPATLADWLTCLGDATHQNLSNLPWYHPTEARPWPPLPHDCSPAELAIDANFLASAARDASVSVLHLAASVVFEDRFNHLVAQTRSKASASFTFVAQHLDHLWQNHGHHAPYVVVDRQSGRTRYLDLLRTCFPTASLRILEESPTLSAYHLEQPPRSMTVRFEVDSEQRHLPTALASMLSKYTRELLMLRFQSFFTALAPTVKPTAGYGADAKRFWLEIQPHLPSLAASAPHLKRRA
ncbi:MAG: hypothetical protein IT442_01440 [Phycisphaeraceae bacterium]|nr:hypothetical protein [Phycisphaeraceae bacterium]